MPPPSLTLIVAATSPALGIGLNGKLPWRLKSELAYFARVTKRGGRNAVIMGRKTWESIPARFRPLPERVNVVLSRDASLVLDGAITATSVDDALARLGDDIGRVFVIGGAQIYAAALAHPAGQTVLLTRIDTPFEVDTYFPVRLDAGGWRRESSEALCEFVGEQVPAGVQKEGDVEYEYELWRRE